MTPGVRSRLHAALAELRTSYGAMSEWLRYGKGRHRSSMLQASLLPRRNCTDYTIRGSRRSSHQQHQTLGANGFLGADMQSAARAAALDENVPVHARYASGCGYDDFYNSFLAVKRHGPAEDFPVFGPPRLRHGRAGGSWRHVKEVLQAGGKRIVFVDGQISANDVLKLDHVPGGHLILPSHTGHSTSDDHVPLLDSFRSVILPPPSVPQANYRPVTVQKGLEKDNWAIIR
ncbi:uncharacterized protein LOC112573386 isoform X2 [Pomacea canaliculata]|uniref:uncharacterized protein LOC112573386 isoform X2 n=1 Tax=Pomacea canaliculata TaxID=400727 RepID=UPI000D734C49|nr:uncharacterized protein LOC112573386 isoform X2 [Pomacea canaliculata]